MHQKSIVKKKGFTLIELVVILAILSLLAAMASIYASNILQKSKDRVDISNVSYLNSATRVYRVETGNWPDQATDLVSDYIDSIPVSPTGGSYEYDGVDHEFSYVEP
ncbi:type II secretion system protein [Alkalibacter mobilis]|uniref:type II secretion system protein n=1 Tax=Alkalibacter mobilis TaxID=2787712 RepID=UPI00189D6112|nr:prepilin-type N-terminal cleavage/methylation domain-containing protein [Alkalibacter mobilis]MBF7095760.1 prepilin-type N-terminal cleavage/methylation domain-containing protein [Alkalibacter mobilis]